LEHALTFYHKAQALDWEHALLTYRIARVCDRLGRKGEALEFYQRARDQDICPLRMPSRHEAALARIAAQTSTPLVDVAGLLASKCPDGIPGNDWYLDHVHPTIRGHQLIAQAISAKLRETGLTPAGAVWPEEQRRAAYQRQIEQLGEIYFADGRRRVAWLENWARRQRLFDETLPKDAAGFMRLGFKRLELDENDAAWEAFHEALNRDPTLAPRLKDHAGELFAEGRSLAASNLLENLNSHGEIHAPDSRRAGGSQP
jgi:tetratricopeptide (TPR) repeat protein